MTQLLVILMADNPVLCIALPPTVTGLYDNENFGITVMLLITITLDTVNSIYHFSI